MMTIHARAARTLLVGVAALALAAPVWAQTTEEQQAPATNAASPADEEVADEIIVTGTRRLGRSVTDSASPIDVISADDLTASPTANMLDTLSNIVLACFTRH